MSMEIFGASGANRKFSISSATNKVGFMIRGGNREKREGQMRNTNYMQLHTGVHMYYTVYAKIM